MLSRVLELNNKWKKKYNKLCLQYETIADKKINELEKVRDALLDNIRYRDEIDCLKKELSRYKRKFGKLEGGDENDKDKDK